MNIGLNVKRTAGALVAATTLGLGALSAAPATADTFPQDRPKITEHHFDFGRHWYFNGPKNGGYLDWNFDDGIVTPALSGYLYLTDKECGKILVKYYDEHTGYLSSDSSARECAPGNGKTQWWVTLDDYSSATVDTVEVYVESYDESTGSYTNVGHVTEHLAD
jgi:hypothetical protein